MTLKYKIYLASEEWGVIRSAVLALGGNKCANCRSDQNLQVHHVTYDNLYHEKPEDLTILCLSCHTDLHDPAGESRRDKARQPGLSTQAYYQKILKGKKSKGRKHKKLRSKQKART